MNSLQSANKPTPKKHATLFSVLCLCVALVVMFVLCSCSGSSKNYSLVKNNTLTVATSADAYPFEYLDNDEITGFDIEVAKELSKRLGLELSVQNVPFSEIPKLMENGRSYDVAIASLTIPSEQPKGVAYSQAYFHGDNAVIIRASQDDEVAAAETDKPASLIPFSDGFASQTGISLESLKDKSVAAVAGYSQFKYAKETVSENVIEYPNVQACLNALANGEVEAAVVEYYQARSIISSYPSLQLLLRDVTVDSYGVMVNSGSAELLDEINQALDSMKKDGTLSDIEKRILG